MNIGNLTLPSRILLAPMLEPNDIAFRLLCKQSGCGLTFTGMVSPLSKQNLDLSDKPALQIFASSVKGIPEFIKAHDSKVSLWDFNLGCPSPLSKRLGHGVFLQEDKKTVEEILKIMRAYTERPITIKLRKSPHTEELVKIAEKYCDAIAIHPRTAAQGYAGDPDYAFALKIKKQSHLPVIYSGNVHEKNVKQILNDFDFVQIGRAAIGNPNIFSKMSYSKNKVSFNNYLSLAKKHMLPFKQIKYQAMNFTKSLSQAKKLRNALIKTKTLLEIEEVMKTHK